MYANKYRFIYLLYSHAAVSVTTAPRPSTEEPLPLGSLTSNNTVLEISRGADVETPPQRGGNSPSDMMETTPDDTSVTAQPAADDSDLSSGVVAQGSQSSASDIRH